jgi:hypothetical protein
MRVACQKCHKHVDGISKSQAYDIARFEGICKCPTSLLAISSEPDPDWLNDVERDLRDIAELEDPHEEFKPTWARW